MTILELARPDIVEFAAYEAAFDELDAIRLNANETPLRHSDDLSERGLNLYPPERPDALTQCLADHFDVDKDTLLVTRGSSEAIDLLIRVFCQPEKDAIVVCQPTFAMYGVYALAQGAKVIDIARGEAPDFALNVDSILSNWTDRQKMLFITAPNNPTGSPVSRAEIEKLIEGLRNKAIIVLDCAYCEFGDDPEPQQHYKDEPHVVVLRTLSKAYGLAGARCGAMIANPQIKALANKLLSPYALATPVIEAVLRVFKGSGITECQKQIGELINTRDWFAEQLSKLPSVTTLCPSAANFLFVQFTDASAAAEEARRQGLLIRHYPDDPKYSDYLRISIGERETMQRLLDVLIEQGKQS